MSFSHPRRTTKTTASATLTPSTSSNASGRLTVNTNMSLQKGATFHHPTTPECELPYHFKTPALPRRSKSTLDDVVDAHKRRVALTLGDIDRGLLSVENPSSVTRQSFPDEADPVPQGFLNHTVGSPTTKTYGPIMDGVMSKEPASIGRHSLRPRINRRTSKYADSALGSSIGSGSGKTAADTLPTSVSGQQVTKSVGASTITRSAAAHSSTLKSLPRLSERAANRIQEHILRPLLAKPSLEAFRPIVSDCPRRINENEIVCLRDLEKTLMFMAPERTKTAALYLDFCLTSIRCIQASVEFLTDREQTRPTDRPYTNGYFIDLIEQIKQYAREIHAAREKEEKGEKLSELDAETGDELRLHGGLTKNGRPAELVRVKKNGKAISVATGEPIDLEEDNKDVAMRFKRSLSEEADAEEVLRSMARRKRSASAEPAKRCREKGCDKEFKRPCDLTKHEKTHSRPWKCPEESCKYHEYGWPTEKEAQRHHNDKHSAAPAMYECKYPPCAYKSKRESNCKQHMEKAHGWVYQRSKNNGKNRDKAVPPMSASNGLPTPVTTNIRTPSSTGNDMPTPGEGSEFDVQTNYKESEFGQNFPEYDNDILDTFEPYHMQLDYSPESDFLSDVSPYTANMVAGENHFDDNFTNFQPATGADFPLFEDEDLYSANAQLPTPSPQVFQHAAFETSGQLYGSEHAPHISPHGHGNAMLYTPISHMDEGFEDFAPNNCGMNNDFPLFPSAGGPVGGAAPTALFGELSPNTDIYRLSNAQLLDFYAQSTAAALAQNQNNTGMDWVNEDQFTGYRSQ